MRRTVLRGLVQTGWVSFVIGVAMLGLTGPVMAQLTEWEAQVAAQLEGIRDEIGGEFDAVSDIMVGELEQGGVGEFTVRVEEGVEYFFMAVCDADCGDLDLALFDEDDVEMISDVEPDEYPYMHFGAERDGIWTVRVLMAHCEASECLYGAQGYAR